MSAPGGDLAAQCESNHPFDAALTSEQVMASDEAAQTNAVRRRVALMVLTRSSHDLYTWAKTDEDSYLYAAEQTVALREHLETLLALVKSAEARLLLVGTQFE